MRLPILLSTLLLACGGPSATPQPGAQPEHTPHAQGHSDHHHDADHGGPDAKDGSHRQHRMPAHFRGAEEWAKRFDHPERDQWQKPQVVIQAMSLSPGMTVADIGAGTGYFLPYLSRAVGTTGKVLGLDIEEDMVRYMNERAAREALPNVEARRIAPDSPGLDRDSVDRVLTVNTWHHISDRSAYAARVRQGMRLGGSLVVVDFFPHSKKGPPKNHKLAAHVVAQELAAAGLKVQVLTDRLPEQYIVIGRK